MGFKITNLSITDTLACGAQLRTAIDGQPSVEAVSRKACEFFCDSFLDNTGAPAIALARLYLTHPYAQLPLDDQRFARNLLEAPVARWPDLKCLTLMGTRGSQPEWNDRTLSSGHRAIPLPTANVVAQAPMIAQLFIQMGVELNTVLKPDPALLTDMTKKTYNVFHVPKAPNSPFIPAQDNFVRKYRIESVVGFGGAVPWGEHFAVVLFSRAPITASAAARFKSLALDLKSRLLKFSVDKVFGEPEAENGIVPTPAFETATAGTSTTLENVEASMTRVREAGGGFRQFRDARGVEWSVWAVVPSATTMLGTRSARWQGGWLLFESAGESRRLSPIPDKWERLQERELEGLCSQAKRKPPTPDLG